MNKDFMKKYLQNVEKALIGNKKDKKAFFIGFKRDVTSYLDSHPDCTEEDIYLQFGKPEDIGDSFLADEDAVEFWKKTKIKSLCRRLLIVFFTICALVLVALFAYRIWDMYNLHNGHYELTLEEEPFSEDPEALGVY